MTFNLNWIRAWIGSQWRSRRTAVWRSGRISRFSESGALRNSGPTEDDQEDTRSSRRGGCWRNRCVNRWKHAPKFEWRMEIVSAGLYEFGAKKVYRYTNSISITIDLDILHVSNYINRYMMRVSYHFYVANHLRIRSGSIYIYLQKLYLLRLVPTVPNFEIVQGSNGEICMQIYWNIAYFLFNFCIKFKIIKLKGYNYYINKSASAGTLYNVTSVIQTLHRKKIKF